MKDPYTTSLAKRSLQPIIDYCERERGAVQGIRERVNKRTKKNWSRKNIDRWLSSDKKKWVQPLFGIGVVLIEEGIKYIQDSNGK